MRPYLISSHGSAGIYPTPAIDDTGLDVDTIRILCGRRIEGNQPVLHGGYGCDPTTVPWDVERAMPMLGFFALPVGRTTAAGRMHQFSVLCADALRVL